MNNSFSYSNSIIGGFNNNSNNNNSNFYNFDRIFSESTNQEEVNFQQIIFYKKIYFY